MATDAQTSKLSESATPTNMRWVMAAGLILPITFVMALDRTAMTVSAPLIQKIYHFNLDEMAVILTAFTWSYALFQVPGGFLVRKFGPRKVLAFAGVWWSVFTFLTPYGAVFLGFAVIRILLGIGQAADWPSSVYALQKWFPHRERSRANSLLLAGLYLGTFIGSPIIVEIADHLGWQASFHIFAGLGFLLAIAWFVFSRDDPAQAHGVNRAEADLIASDGEDKAPMVRVKAAQFIGSSQFWALGIEYALLLFIQGFFTTWLPTYLVQARHLSFTSMGFVGALPWGAMIVAVFGTGYLNDRLFRTWKARTWTACVGFAIAAVALVTGALVPNNGVMITFMCISLAGVGIVQVQVWAGCQDLGGRYAATVTGFANMCGNLTAAFGPIFTALIVGIGGNWVVALLVLALAGVLGIVCWLFVHPERPLELKGQLVAA